MIPLHSVLENRIYPLYVLEEKMMPGGYVIESNWDYNGAYVDLKIDIRSIIFVVRIPFYAVAGSLDYPGVTVWVNQPYLLAYEHEKEISGRGMERITSDQTNQSPQSFEAAAENVMKKVEELLSPG